MFNPLWGGKKQLQRRPLCRRPRCCMVLYFQCNTLSPRRKRNGVYVLHFQLSGIQHVTEHITSVALCNTHQPASDGHLYTRCCIVLHFRVVSCNTLLLHSALPMELPILCPVYVRACVPAYVIKKLDRMTRGYLTRYAYVCYNKSVVMKRLPKEVIKMMQKAEDTELAHIFMTRDHMSRREGRGNALSRVGG